MAVTKKTLNKRTAEKRIEKEESVGLVKPLKTPEGQRNIEIIRSLTYEEACDWVEHIILLRIIHGQDGFLNDQFNYAVLLEEEWNAIKQFGMGGLFHGRGPGFGAEWLTRNMWDRLNHCSETDFARWITNINLMPWYIREIIAGKKHLIVLCNEADPKIVAWLNERNGVK